MIISVIINNFNYARYLAGAIDGALAQALPAAEVVVVDDGSTDGSRDVIAGYGDRIRAVFKANGGQASAFDAGLRESRGDAIIFLDADDILLPGATTAVAPYFRDPGVVKVHWPLWVIDAEGRRTGERLPRDPLPAGDLRHVVLTQGPDSYLSPPTSGNAWSRRFLERVSPIPEHDYRQGADGYLITLAPLFGKLERLDEPQGCYRVHGKNQYWSGSLGQRIEGSLIRYERRHRSLAHHLSAAGLGHDSHVWRESNAYYQWMVRVKRSLDELRSVVPEESVFIMVDEGQWGEQPVPDRRALPFIEKDGLYWGAPADDESAIRELDRLRGAGARFIAFAWHAFWWLDHYTGLSRHLRSSYPRVLENDRLIVFDLNPTSPDGSS